MFTYVYCVSDFFRMTNPIAIFSLWCCGPVANPRKMRLPVSYLVSIDVIPIPSSLRPSYIPRCARPSWSSTKKTSWAHPSCPRSWSAAFLPGKSWHALCRDEFGTLPACSVTVGLKYSRWCRWQGNTASQFKWQWWRRILLVPLGCKAKSNIWQLA